MKHRMCTTHWVSLLGHHTKSSDDTDQLSIEDAEDGEVTGS